MPSSGGLEDPLARAAGSAPPIHSKTFDGFAQRFASDREGALQLINFGQSQATPTFEPTELAAYTLLANLILNLDEAVTRN